MVGAIIDKLQTAESVVAKQKNSIRFATPRNPIIGLNVTLPIQPFHGQQSRIIRSFTPTSEEGHNLDIQGTNPYNPMGSPVVNQSQRHILSMEMDEEIVVARREYVDNTPPVEEYSTEMSEEEMEELDDSTDV